MVTRTPSDRTPSRSVALNSPSVAAWSDWLIGRPNFGGVPAISALEAVIDHRVHEADVDRQLKALAIAAHGVMV